MNYDAQQAYRFVGAVGVVRLAPSYRSRLLLADEVCPVVVSHLQVSMCVQSVNGVPENCWAWATDCLSNQIYIPQIAPLYLSPSTALPARLVCAFLHKMVDCRFSRHFCPTLEPRKSRPVARALLGVALDDRP